MTYEPRTDFLAILRDRGTSNRVGSMPGIDFVVAALARAGLVSISASPTPPTSAQATTLWLKTGSPDYASEGDVLLWDTSLPTPAYASATPALFAALIFAAAGASGSDALSTILDGFGSTVGGALVRGVDGWTEASPDAPAQMLVSGNPNQPSVWSTLSTMLDAAAGNTPGMILYRAADGWQALAPGTTGQLLQMDDGTTVAWGGIPSAVISAGLDELGADQGDVLFRGAAGWQALPAASAAGLILTSGGADADVSWTDVNNPSGITSVGTGLTLTGGAVGSRFGTDTAVADNISSPMTIPSSNGLFTITNFTPTSSDSITAFNGGFTINDTGTYLLVMRISFNAMGTGGGSGVVWNATVVVDSNGSEFDRVVDNGFEAGSSSQTLQANMNLTSAFHGTAGDTIQIQGGMFGTVVFSAIAVSVTATLMRIN